MSETGIEFVIVILWLVILIAPMFICASRAKKKNRSETSWALLGLCFGWLAVILILIVGSEQSEEDKFLDRQLKQEQLKELKRRK